MQLKVYLLIASVLNVACLNVEKDSSSLRDIFADVAPMRMNKSIESVKKDPSSFVELLADVAPMRMNQSVELLKKDPSSFVELFAGANPDVINQVIGLLETLVSEADSSLTTLTDRVTETSNNFATANNELVAAQDALTAASTAKLNAENAETAAKEKHDTAKAEKDAAQNSFDDQSPTYLEEKRVLQEVIEKLRPLSGSSAKSICSWQAYSSPGMLNCPEPVDVVTTNLDDCKAQALTNGANGIQFLNGYCRFKSCTTPGDNSDLVGSGVELRWQSYYYGCTSTSPTPSQTK